MGDLSELVPKDLSEVTSEWLAAVFLKHGVGKKNCKIVQVVKIEGEKVQSGLLSAAFRCVFFVCFILLVHMGSVSQSVSQSQREVLRDFPTQA